MKVRHDGDCTIYSALANGRPEDGICTCGYAHQLRGETGDISAMYSEELKKKLRGEHEKLRRKHANTANGLSSRDADQLIKKISEG